MINSLKKSQTHQTKKLESEVQQAGEIMTKLKNNKDKETEKMKNI